MLSDFIARLNSRSIEFGMAKEAHIHTDSHSWLQNVVAVRAKERFFSLMQPDGVREWAYQVTPKTVFDKIISSGSIDLTTQFTGH